MTPLYCGLAVLMYVLRSPTVWLWFSFTTSLEPSASLTSKLKNYYGYVPLSWAGHTWMLATGLASLNLTISCAAFSAAPGSRLELASGGATEGAMEPSMLPTVGTYI